VKLTDDVKQRKQKHLKQYRTGKQKLTNQENLVTFLHRGKPLYPHDLQQQNQFLALKVSRNHPKNNLNSATRDDYELAMFSRELYILPPPLVFVKALQTVSCQPT